MLDHVPTICRFCVPEKHLLLLLQKQLIEHAVFAALAAAAACFQTEMVIASRFTERKGPNCYVPPSSNDILVFSFCVYIRRSWRKKKDLALDQYFRLHVLLNVRFFASYPDEL